MKFKFSWVFCILLGNPNPKVRFPDSSSQHFLGKIVTCEDMQQY